MHSHVLLFITALVCAGCSNSLPPGTVCENETCQCVATDRFDCGFECPGCRYECSRGNGCDFTCRNNGCVATCRDTTACTSTCGLNCQLTCRNSKTCQSSCGAGCIYTCQDADSCTVTVGANSQANCTRVGACNFTCEGQCQVKCVNAGACNVKCRVGDAIAKDNGIKECPQ